MHQPKQYQTELSILLSLFEEHLQNFVTDMMRNQSKLDIIGILEEHTSKTDKYLERFVFLSNQLEDGDPLKTRMLNGIPFMDFENTEAKQLLEKYRTLPPDADILDYM